MTRAVNGRPFPLRMQPRHCRRHSFAKRSRAQGPPGPWTHVLRRRSLKVTLGPCPAGRGIPGMYRVRAVLGVPGVASVLMALDFDSLEGDSYRTASWGPSVALPLGPAPATPELSVWVLPNRPHTSGQNIEPHRPAARRVDNSGSRIYHLAANLVDSSPCIRRRCVWTKSCWPRRARCWAPIRPPRRSTRRSRRWSPAGAGSDCLIGCARRMGSILATMR